MKSLAFLGLIVWVITASAHAGNGVERGRLVLGENQFLGKEIQKYISKTMVRCIQNTKTDYLQVKGISIEEDHVDQGIIDLYYTVDMLHKNAKGNVLNEVSIQVEDLEFSNYRQYEERLTIKVLKDRNQFCR